MKQYRLKIVASSYGTYTFAIYSEHGFAHYEVFRRTPYYQNKIRKIAYRFGVPLPAKLDWDKLPADSKIEMTDEMRQEFQP